MKEAQDKDELSTLGVQGLLPWSRRVEGGGTRLPTRCGLIGADERVPSPLGVAAEICPIGRFLGTKNTSGSPH